MNENLANSTNYPTPPWTVYGQGLMVFAFPAARKSCIEFPDGLTVQSMCLGKTISGYYLAQYDRPLIHNGDTPWHEWGDIAAFSHSSIGNGFWIDEMAVDSQAALLGGKNVWGLNKKTAEIQFVPLKKGGEARLVLPDGKIDLSWKEWGPQIALQPVFPFLSKLDGQIIQYRIQFNALFQLCRADIKRRDIPAFSSLSPNKYWAIRFRNAEIRISKPTSRSL